MVASFVLLEVHKYGMNLDLDLDALKQKDCFGIIAGGWWEWWVCKQECDFIELQFLPSASACDKRMRRLFGPSLYCLCSFLPPCVL